MATKPQEVYLDWDLRKLTPEKIAQETDSLINHLKGIIDGVAAVSVENATYENVMKPLEIYHRDSFNKGRLLDMPQHTVEEKTLRDASCEAEKKVEEFEVEISMREDIFKRIQKVQETGMEGLTHEQKRFVDKQVLKGKRCGLHLDAETQKKIKDLKTRSSELSIKFSSNLNEDDTKLYLSKEQLDGLPDDFIKALKTNDKGLLEVTIKYDHLFPITKKCKVPETRKAIITAANQKCMKENTPLLEELITIRHKIAQLLGYKTHAQYVLDDRMAKTPEAVTSFLNDLKEKLEPLVVEERKTLLELKEEECKELGIAFDGNLNIWDSKYYQNMVEIKKYSVDNNVLREYFPSTKVISGMFDIYQTLLGVTFVKVDDAPVWHKDVNMYRVTDTESGDLMGFFFMDLYPRTGKYSHAAVFPLQPACTVDGTSQVSVCALICNFTKPTEEKPALFIHSEVETLFHEFGHAMHHICSRVDNPMFHGTSVSRDFVEAPSQMLENWVWEKESLTLMSEHYETKKPIPDQLLSNLAASRKANAGFLNIRQVSLATFDQTIHRSDQADTAATFARIQKELTGFDAIPDTNMPANFGHMGGGYDAQYYGYLWSEVFCMDMYATRFAGKVMDPKAGMAYRKIILERGGSVDAMDLLVEFLGREPKNDAFLESKGLKV